MERGLIIELDGSQHATELGKAYDLERTAYLNAAGFQVLRFWNHEVLEDLPQVLRAVKTHLKGSSMLEAVAPLSLGERVEPCSGGG